jgi:hypothetical protein
VPRRPKQKNNSGIKRSEDAADAHPAVARDFLIPVVMVMMVVIVSMMMMVMVPPIIAMVMMVMVMVLSESRLAVRARVGSFRVLVLEQSECAWDRLEQVPVRCGRF